MLEDDARRLAAAASSYREHLGRPEEAERTAELRRSPEALAPAIERLVELGDADAALEMAADLATFWQDAGLVALGLAATDHALRAGDGSPVPRARAFLAVSELAFRTGDQERTLHAAEDAIRLATEHGATTVAGRALINLARMCFRNADADGIAQHVDRAKAIAGDDPSVRRGVLHMRAWEAYVRGDVDEAHRRFDESIAFARSQADRYTEVSEQANIADLALERGDVDSAVPRLSAALSVAEDVESRYLLLSLCVSAARVAAEVGRLDDALAILSGVQAGHRDAGSIGDPTEDADADAIVDCARRALPAGRSDAAWARGASMGRDELLRVARDVLGSTGS